MRMRGQTFRLWVPVICVFMLFWVTTGCTKADKPAEPAPKAEPKDPPLELVSEGKLIVGTSPDYPPYEFRLQREEISEIVGLDIAIAEVIAKELNLELEIRDYYFSKLFLALDNGEVDMVIAGLSPTEERKQTMDFSDVYYKALQNMVVRKADFELFSNLDNLRDKRLGAQQSSIQAGMIKKLVRGAQFFEKETVVELIEALRANELDAVMIEAPVAEAMAYKDPDLAIIEITGTEQIPEMNMIDSAIAVKKGNKALLDRINEVIRKLIADNRIESFAADATALMDQP